MSPMQRCIREIAVLVAGRGLHLGVIENCLVLKTDAKQLLSRSTLKLQVVSRALTTAVGKTVATNRNRDVI